MTFRDAAAAILVGLWRTLERILLTLGILAGIGLLGLLLALPLWAFSSFRPRGYTWFALAVLGGGVLFLLGRRIRRRSDQEGGFPAWMRRRVLPALKRAAIVLAFIVAAYAALILFARGFIAGGALVAVAAVLLGGYLRFVRRRKVEEP